MGTRAWRLECGDGSMGMRVWGSEHGAFFLVVFFSRKNIFSSDDFISHMAMEEWECCIYLVDSLFRLHFLFCKSFGMRAEDGQVGTGEDGSME